MTKFEKPEMEVRPSQLLGSTDPACGLWSPRFPSIVTTPSRRREWAQGWGRGSSQTEAGNNAHFPKVFCRVDTHEHWDPARVVLGVHTHHVGASGREWARRDPLEGRREPPEQRGADLSAGLAGPEAADGTGAAAVFGRGRGSSPGQVMVWLKEAGKGGRHVFGARPVSVLLPGSQQRGRGAHRKEGQRCRE